MIDKNKFTPIVIFTYNRLDSLIQTIQHLSKNIYKEYTDLIIFSDSWRSEKDKQDVLNVRKFLQSIKEFKSLNVIKRGGGNLRWFIIFTFKNAPNRNMLSYLLRGVVVRVFGYPIKWLMSK